MPRRYTATIALNAYVELWTKKTSARVQTISEASETAPARSAAARASATGSAATAPAAAAGSATDARSDVATRRSRRLFFEGTDEAAAGTATGMSGDTGAGAASTGFSPRARESAKAPAATTALAAAPAHSVRVSPSFSTSTKPARSVPATPPRVLSAYSHATRCASPAEGPPTDSATAGRLAPIRNVGGTRTAKASAKRTRASRSGWLSSAAKRAG